MTLTIGSLFTGYGGLDLAVEAVLDARTVWTSDIDPGASRIIAHRWPDAPNLGDIGAVDWTAVQSVDVITGGFPCQDVSHAGARRGLRPGTRSGLWARMADAIDHLRPALVVAENVRGLLSAAADSDVEPCPWCMGGTGDGEPPLRALGSVLADLADLGYDAAWHGLRASDVGAPHGRFRVFVLAWPAAGDPGRVGVQRRADPRGVAGTPRAGEGEGLQRERRGDTARDASADAADTDEQGREGPEPTAGRLLFARRPSAAPDARGEAVRLGPGLRPDGPRRIGRGRPDDDRAPAPPADASGDGRDEGRPEPARVVGRPHAAVRRDAVADDWGPYGPAIRRWERALGRPAPAPTEPGRTGAQRLSPPFVEWMMGLPGGWVTAVPGLSRNEQLKALGNGVVPQQAAAALTTLLAWRHAALNAPALDLLEAGA